MPGANLHQKQLLHAGSMPGVDGNESTCSNTADCVEQIDQESVVQMNTTLSFLPLSDACVTHMLSSYGLDSKEQPPICCWNGFTLNKMAIYKMMLQKIH